MCLSLWSVSTAPLLFSCNILFYLRLFNKHLLTSPCQGGASQSPAGTQTAPCRQQRREEQKPHSQEKIGEQEGRPSCSCIQLSETLLSGVFKILKSVRISIIYLIRRQSISILQSWGNISVKYSIILNTEQNLKTRLDWS